MKTDIYAKIDNLKEDIEWLLEGLENNQYRSLRGLASGILDKADDLKWIVSDYVANHEPEE